MQNSKTATKAAPKAETKYGITISGKIRVFAKARTITSKANKKTYDVLDHWVNVSEKEDDGTWYNKGVNLIFGRDAETPENNTIINIIEGFPMITGSGDYRRVAWFIRSWDYAEA